ncbi:Ger(x)C family spore germination protein [Maledivibacter halophilus]|uniref:Germination protein, Ger(X)C family n=1 Tax=Maledivibacter halophilus TaxID=36842 RepID=A0A1T5MBQ8_9FIRM|nr:Ger(x)C family spore germination protein [Maledivibacter halophilus]SKC85605.1 germination protein, Ger(x)C family [Maledivibacter halophilus]
MMKKANKLLILLVLTSFLTGCWDYKDINMRAIALSIGVDLADKNIEFSGEVAKILSLSDIQQEKTHLSNVYNVLSYGKTFEEARLDYDAKNPLQTFLGAARVVIFGENFAKEGIESYLHRIDSLYDYRKTLLPVISRDRPKDLFEKKIVKDISVGFLIEDILTQLEEDGEALYPYISELLSDISFGKIGYLIPYIGIENNSIKYLGLAVMKNSKMIDVIKIENTFGILYLLSENLTLVEPFPSINDKNNTLSFRTKIKKRKIKTDYKNEQILINIDLSLFAELKYQYSMQPVSNEDIKKYEKVISKKVSDNINSIIEKAQKEFQCDIFRFAKEFRGNHPKIYKKINWEDEFPNAEININVETKIRNTTLSDTNARKKY